MHFFVCIQDERLSEPEKAFELLSFTTIILVVFDRTVKKHLFICILLKIQVELLLEPKPNRNTIQHEG